MSPRIRSLSVLFLLASSIAAHATDADKIAEEAHLPRSAAGFTLASAKRNRANHDLQLLYKNDKQTISVFVGKDGGKHRLSDGWSRSVLSRQRVVFTHTAKDEAAMAWTGARGYRFIALKRGTLKQLQPFVEAVFTAPPASPRP